MFEFLIRRSVIHNAQKAIDKLEPKVNAHVSDDIPLPSAREFKRLSRTASQINGLEATMSALTDEQLKNKTGEFRRRYDEEVRADKQAFLGAERNFVTSVDSSARENLSLEMKKAHERFKKTRQDALNEILPEAFAVVREAGKRVTNMRHFDVQLIGGIALHEGNIAEMTTGEGKTLVATLPAYLNALTGEGVHVVTVNDYLAVRDRDWMGPIYEFLGLSVGVIRHGLDARARREAYGCDITYGTNNEFGFDYLRDNMVGRKEDMVQRPHHFAIVDEVDSILIDESRTPLIISGPAEESTDKYYKAEKAAPHLKGRRMTEKDEVDAKYKQIDLAEGYDYLADEKHKTISLTEDGEKKASELLGVANLHEIETMEDRHHILQALKAKEFFRRDVEYVVNDGQVIIVDEFTGRMMPGRRWSDGLHQAVEAKEGLKIERENQTLATITFQNYFRLYDKLSGMTGTADTEAMEFKQIYNLDVLVIPTNKKVQRKNYPDSVYRTQQEKYDAIITEINECHGRGQPVLVGTVSIEKSEIIARLLKARGIAHNVLNAKFHEQEANIIAQAGRFKAVTIATNMAGRGTDIVLGGNAEYLAKALAEAKFTEHEDSDEKRKMIHDFIETFRQETKDEHKNVVEQGGLHVIGSERHESRRIDNQLRGRQGRQGDPGSSRFFVSLEDDLMRLFGGERLMALMSRMGMEDGQVLEHTWLNRAIATAQKRVENHFFEIRKHLLEYDNVMNKQREVIYRIRRTVLESEDIKMLILEAIEDAADRLTYQYVSVERQGQKDFESLRTYLETRFGYALDLTEDQTSSMKYDELREHLIKGLEAIYQKKEEEMTPQRLRPLERVVFLHTIDTRWKEHLYAMDQMKEGVGLRSFAQRDPLVEYKKEGFAMFRAMYEAIYQEVAEVIFKVQQMGAARNVFAVPQRLIHQEIEGGARAAIQPPQANPMTTAQPRVGAQRAVPLQSGSMPMPGMSPPAGWAGRIPTGMPQAPDVPASGPTAPIHRSEPKVGRNDLCPCGSGKKYKKCCGK